MKTCIIFYNHVCVTGFSPFLELRMLRRVIEWLREKLRVHDKIWATLVVLVD